MFSRLFGRKRPMAPAAQAPDSPLLLANDDRNVIYETDDAETLARIMLTGAQEQCRGERSGFELIVTVPEGHGHVHYMELLLQMMNIDREFGFRAGTMFNNQLHLTKL